MKRRKAEASPLIEYTIIRKDTDSIMAHVLDNGSVEVHMPFEAPDQAAEDVVNHYLADLEKQIQMRKQVIETKKSINYSFQPLLFGKRYPLVKSEGDFYGFKLEDECFYVPPGLRQHQLKNGLRNLYMKIGHSDFSKRMKEFSELMDVRFTRLQISRSPSPFGACIGQGELIELSWALVMTDDAFVDSVIIHELAHTKYDDHYSPEFIALVKEFCPDYDEIQKRGNSYEIMLRADGWIKMKL